MTLRCTLLADGSSDRALVPIISWTLRQHLPDVVLSTEVADLGRSRRPPDRGDVVGRIERAFDLSPCDVLFVHRDAERPDALSERVEEIRDAAHLSPVTVPIIPVVPVRMTESWLLFDVEAIRAAAGNPRGTATVSLPAAPQQERVHAKEDLADHLRRASGLTGRRAKRFSTADSVQRLASLIEDFSPLRRLDSFRAFEEQVYRFVGTRARL